MALRLLDCELVASVVRSFSTRPRAPQPGPLSTERALPHRAEWWSGRTELEGSALGSTPDSIEGWASQAVLQLGETPLAVCLAWVMSCPRSLDI